MLTIWYGMYVQICYTCKGIYLRLWLYRHYRTAASDGVKATIMFVPWVSSSSLQDCCCEWRAQESHKPSACLERIYMVIVQQVSWCFSGASKDNCAEGFSWDPVEYSPKCLEKLFTLMLSSGSVISPKQMSKKRNSKLWVCSNQFSLAFHWVSGQQEWWQCNVLTFSDKLKHYLHSPTACTV